MNLNEIKARLSARTPGKWEKFYGRVVIDLPTDFILIAEALQLDTGEADADFIAHAPQDIADLINEVERLTARCQEVAEVMGTIGIEDYEWRQSWKKRTGVKASYDP